MRHRILLVVVSCLALLVPAAAASARRSPLSPLGAGDTLPDVVAGTDAAAAAVGDHNLGA